MPVATRVRNQPRVNASNVREVFELYYKKDGQRKSVILNSKPEVNRKRESLRRAKRKFLGYRLVRLVELVD